MATWKTADEISRRFIVGADRLDDYSRRGNLPRSFEADGTVLFDEDMVARFFRPRHAQGVLLTSPDHLGVLGETRLGAYVLPTTLGARETRRRALRTGQVESVSATLRRTGTG